MATQVQNRRGSTAEHSTFTGAVGEVTVDTDKDVVVVHDGATAGGYPQMRENGSNSALALGSAGTPSLKFTGDTNTGIYSPGADQVAISTGGSGRLFVDSSGNVGVGTNAPGSTVDIRGNLKATNTTNAVELVGNQGAIEITRTGGDPFIDLKNSSASDYDVRIQQRSNGLAIDTGGNGAASERFRITSAGLVGIGTSAPEPRLDVQANSGGVFRAANTGVAQVYVGFGGGSSNYYDADNQYFRNGTGSTTRLLIDSSGRVGIGTTAPVSLLQVGNFSGNNLLTIGAGTSSYGGVVFADGSAGTDAYRGGVYYLHGSDSLQFDTAAAERVRIDGSGRLLVGTSSAAQYNHFSDAIRFQLAGTSSSTSSAQFAAFENAAAGPLVILAKSRGGSVGANTVVQSGDPLGSVLFIGADGTNYIRGASITGEVDGTPGANDMPGRLVFSTTADGASSPTERMRITSDGTVLLDGSVLSCVRSSNLTAAFDRRTNDGTIITLRQDGTDEGSISVSGTTVSYNGAHLSRWSQLPSGAERTEILRGTILSNIDEMCEWGEEDNEQLNRMKVSDVEGDKNVSGVFQAWDDDDDTYTNDFYCAMTGDFIIRIGAGVTVERGDLLMSAGDGTAKPQDDDIIRSKTIAKVTSTNVSCTYDDGSYCVPCVLMAC